MCLKKFMTSFWRHFVVQNFWKFAHGVFLSGSIFVQNLVQFVARFKFRCIDRVKHGFHIVSRLRQGHPWQSDFILKQWSLQLIILLCRGKLYGNQDLSFSKCTLLPHKMAIPVWIFEDYEQPINSEQLRLHHLTTYMHFSTIAHKFNDTNTWYL